MMMLILALGTVFTFAACSSDDDDNNGGNGNGPQNTITINGKSYPIEKCSKNSNSSGEYIKFKFENNDIKGSLHAYFTGSIPSGDVTVPQVELEFRYPDNPERPDSPGKIADYAVYVPNVPVKLNIANGTCTFNLSNMKATTTLEGTSQTLAVTVSLNYNGKIE